MFFISPTFSLFLFMSWLVISFHSSVTWELFQTENSHLRRAVSQGILSKLLARTGSYTALAWSAFLHAPTSLQKDVHCLCVIGLHSEKSFMGAQLSKCRGEKLQEQQDAPAGRLVLFILSFRCFKSKGFTSLIVVFLLLSLITFQSNYRCLSHNGSFGCEARKVLFLSFNIWRNRHTERLRSGLILLNFSHS